MRVKHLPLLAAALALLAGPALAQTDTLKKIKDSGTITIGHRESSLPFSYYDDKQQVVGYAMDLCMKVVDAVKAELKTPDLKVALNPVTSATRIPLIANGTIDMECGSTTNNLERQKQVSFSDTYFVTQSRILSKKADGINSLADLKGKQVVSTSGTTSLKLLNEKNTAENLGLTVLPAKDHAEAFLMVETGRAAAFVMDDILLASLAANSKSPADYVITGDALSVEPYAIMLPLGDTAFKKVVDDAMKKIYSSGEIKGIYDKWFTKPIPPKGIVLNVPLSPIFQKVIDNPTDSGDPAAYKP